MAIDFPSSPTNGQTHVVGSVTYTWDGTKWTAVAAGGGASDLDGLTDVAITSSTSGQVLTYDGSGWVNSSGPLSNRNLLFNGEMMIDQRGSASSPVTFVDNVFGPDRWRTQIDGSVTATFGQSGVGTVTSDGSFQKSLLVTCTTSSTPSAGDHASVGQKLERTDVSNLGWGTSSAIPVTLSFYVRSSKTGTYSVGILGGNGANYSYVFEYTISSANTWQKVTKTITGPTIGTWTPGTGTGLFLNFILNNGGSGSAGTLATLDTWTAGNYYAGSPNNVNFFDTNGATFYLTGVQLEVGTVATPFEHRSYGDELARCQRYYFRFNDMTDGDDYGSGFNTSTSDCRPICVFPVTMRTAPSSVEQTGTASDYMIAQGGSEITCTSVPTFSGSSPHNARVVFTASGSLTTGQGSAGRAKGSNSFLAFSAEL